MQLLAMAMARWVLPVPVPPTSRAVMKSTAGKLVDESLVDRRALELEIAEVFSEWQLGDAELVLDERGHLNLDQLNDLKCQSFGRLATSARSSRAGSGPHQRPR